jgi:hypothetical protein
VTHAAGRRATLLAIASVFALAFLARGALTRRILSFRAPYTLAESRAALDGELARLVRTRAGEGGARSVDDAIRGALEITSPALFFGLRHKTRLDFDGVAREGNCIEYAHLFARIFNDRRSDVRAKAVRTPGRWAFRCPGPPGASTTSASS